MDCFLGSILTVRILQLVTDTHDFGEGDICFCFTQRTSRGRQDSIGVAPLHSSGVMAPFNLIAVTK